VNLRLELHSDGVLLPVKAQAGARRSGIRGEHNGMLRVSVTQVAEQGKANAAIVEVLAEELGLRRSQVWLVSGESSSQKRFLVTGITLAELTQRVVTAILRASDA
jgi:hypothetical protein